MKNFLKNAVRKPAKLIRMLHAVLFADNEEILHYIDAEGLCRKIISLLAGNRRDFFFIQIGSCDGTKEDMIRSYIKERHWSGILLEPVRYLFERLVRNYAGEKNLIFENAAVSEEDGFRDFYYLKETNDPMPPYYNELGSFLKDNVLKHKDAIPDIEKYILTERSRPLGWRAWYGGIMLRR